VIALFIGDHESPAIGEPPGRNVRHVLGVPCDLSSIADERVDDEQVLRRVVEDPHHQEPLPIGRPSADHVPERAGEKRPLGARREIGDDDVHVGRRSRIARKGDESSIR